MIHTISRSFFNRAVEFLEPARKTWNGPGTGKKKAGKNVSHQEKSVKDLFKLVSL